MLSVEDGIQQVRSSVPMAWFDAEKCERGIDALMQYRRDWDDSGKAWRAGPSTTGRLTLQTHSDTSVWATDQPSNGRQGLSEETFRASHEV